MRRFHLIEIHEQPWCPRAIRDAATDFMQFATNVASVYRVVVPRLAHGIHETKGHQVVDMCSGGGGPWLDLYREAATSDGSTITITLTDKYPNLKAFRRAKSESEGTLDFCEEPVDVSALPEELVGFRTLFGSFHHFQPPEARAILQNAVDNNEGIGIFEATQRRRRTLIVITLATPISLLAMTPFIRPFRWSRILLTYVVPVIVPIMLFDAVVSCLRTYSKSDLEELISSLEGEPYHWEIGSGRRRGLPIGVTYAIGYPMEKAMESGFETFVDYVLDSDLVEPEEIPAFEHLVEV